MARVNLVFLGKTAELAGTESREWTGNTPRTVAKFIDSIGDKEPDLATMLRAPKTRYALNGDLCTPDAEVQDGDELAFLPPVSGG